MACSAFPGNYSDTCPVNSKEFVLSFDACSPVEPKTIPFKAISIKQPFAGLIAYGGKSLEIRTWSTKYRGRLLICASRTIYRGDVMLPGKGSALLPGKGLDKTTTPAKKFWDAIRYGGYVLGFGTGVAVCTVDLVNVRPMVKEDELAARHPFIEGAFVWEFENPLRINPVEVTGKLGLFDVQLREVEFVID